MKWFRRYRLLMVVFLLAGLRAGWEVVVGEQSSTEALTLVSELYPESAEAHYQRGLAALTARRDYAEARRAFEQALATGIKTNEELLYEYAMVLALMEEDANLVNAAIANWRENFPNSTRVDPRVAARAIPRNPRNQSRGAY